MCLATAGLILGIRNADDPLWRAAEVDFGGVRQEVSLACLPEAEVGDRVLVHVGLALALVRDGDGGSDAAEEPDGPGELMA